MGPLVHHVGLEDEWGSKSLEYQMGNIGSEVSRALKSQDKPARFKGAFERALELFDLTIECGVHKYSRGTMREICRAREEFCDYFNGNSYNTDPVKMQRYYDQFATRR